MVSVDHNFTQILGGSFEQSRLDERILEIEATIEQEDSKHLKGIN